jgi:endonuclease/exonuclease/phosphatase family metal-dependent hydrolase
MQSFGAVARPPLRVGPISRWLTWAHQGFFRSGLAGQANAILVAPAYEAVALGEEQISDPGRERRIVHAVRLVGPPSVVIGNLHATNEFRDPGVPRMEAARALVFLEGLTRPAEPVLLAGDFNIADPGIGGFSPPNEGIDDVLVRGARATQVSTWARERRAVQGIVLSDHAPVDCILEVPA